MSKAYAVIGANYGDEGKGMMTDYLASKDPDRTLVVRFNGGAQAGHTVVCPDGRRHVFSHFGSASFLGCPSFLSRYFIVNPMIFSKELDELQAKGVKPELIIDPAALISTPLDIFINQIIESKRGKQRHGSCGLGINETVKRCLRQSSFKTRLADFLHAPKAKEILRELCRSWLPLRLAELGIGMEEAAVKSFLEKSEQITDRYLIDLARLIDTAAIASRVAASRTLIFEGAQGLLLDEARIDQYPHLTRSRTGLNNILALLPELSNCNTIELRYMSRTYLTRHGAGPLKGEADFSFPDATNIPNQFQGKLRFAELDIDELKYSIELDLKQARGKNLNIDASLALSCADHLEPNRSWRLPLPVSSISYGASRDDLEALNKTGQKRAIKNSSLSLDKALLTAANVK